MDTVIYPALAMNNMIVLDRNSGHCIVQIIESHKILRVIQ